MYQSRVEWVNTTPHLSLALFLNQRVEKKEHISCIYFWRLSTVYVTAPLCKGRKLLRQQYFEANPNPDLAEWIKYPLSGDTRYWESKWSYILSIPAGKFPLRSRPTEKGQSTKATCRAESLKHGWTSVDLLRGSSARQMHDGTKKSKPGPPAEEKSPRHFKSKQTKNRNVCPVHKVWKKWWNDAAAPRKTTNPSTT